MFQKENWFNKKKIYDLSNRTIGYLFRFFGIDFSVMLLGWPEDWKVVDVRIPINYGVYIQIWFLLFSVGRLSTETYEEP